jgi:hypothetical protein
LLAVIIGSRERIRVPVVFSVTELIASASTSLVATLVNPSGASTSLLAAVARLGSTRFSTKAVPFSKIPIFAFPFDGLDRDRFKSFSRRTIARFLL